MNIFILDENPKLAAEYMCDKHIPKMILESAQLLCSAFYDSDGKSVLKVPYKRTHYNHPCAVWVRQSEDNFLWLYDHANALNREYSRRFVLPRTGLDGSHKSWEVASWCLSNSAELQFPYKGLTPFATAMPDECRTSNVVESYRKYYKMHKKDIAKWEKGRDKPYWWND